MIYDDTREKIFDEDEENDAQSAKCDRCVRLFLVALREIIVGLLTNWTF
jgi:hypothetical protein